MDTIDVEGMRTVNCQNIKRNRECISCKEPFGHHGVAHAVMVRVVDNTGYSIALMCHSCIDDCLEARARTASLLI